MYIYTVRLLPWLPVLDNTYRLTRVTLFQVFGVALEYQPKTPAGIPVLLHKCIKFLDNRVDTEGIFRMSGSMGRIQKLKLALNQVNMIIKHNLLLKMFYTPRVTHNEPRVTYNVSSISNHVIWTLQAKSGTLASTFTT